VLDQILLMLHPFMPFVTEELWQRTAEKGPKRESLLVTASWPIHTGLGDKAADAEMDWVIRFISDVRSVRAEMNVPAGAKIALLIKDASAESLARLERHRSLIDRLARLSSVDVANEIPHGAVQLVLDEATLILPLADVIDLKAETARLRKELGKLEDEVKKIDAKLGNAKFLAGAPEHVVEEQRERKAEAQAAMAKFTDALKRLDGAA
jgi:valyl-tRNA synthetase